MARYFIEMAFKGSNYHGWQSQPNAVTVQAVTEIALSTLTRENITTTGAGRTDTGVHAGFYTAHFDTDHPLAADKAGFLYKMNAILPGDIALLDIYQVKPEAHARYSALSRTYRYTISLVKDPFQPEFSWYYPIPLDMEAMNKVALHLLQFNDFTSFSKLHSDVKNNLCIIMEAFWTQEDTHIFFTIKANRFLRNMVRSIVGTMIEIGRGKTSEEEFQSIVEGRNRSLAGFSAPPQGLSLIAIEYPEDIKL